MDCCSRQIVINGLPDFADHVAKALAVDDRRIKRQNDKRKRAVLGKELAANDIVVERAIGERLVGGGVLRQFFRKERLRNAARFRGLARGEQRNDALRAVDELKIGRHIAKRFQRSAIEDVALDNHEHVVLSRWESASDFFVLLEFGGIGTEELAQRIVDLDPHETEDSSN